MYVQTVYDCQSCGNKGFLGRQIDIDMRPPDYHDWEVTIYVKCPKCSHESIITFSQLVALAQRRQQESAENRKKPVKQASLGAKE